MRFAGGDARGALQIAEQAITLDRLHEASWRLALQAEHALGLRESITRRYEELTRSLDEQLGLEPTRETRTIYRQLLGQTEGRAYSGESRALGEQLFLTKGRIPFSRILG